MKLRIKYGDNYIASGISVDTEISKYLDCSNKFMSGGITVEVYNDYPDAYQKVEYLHSYGEAFLNIGIHPSLLHKIDITFMLTDITTKPYPSIFDIINWKDTRESALFLQYSAGSTQKSMWYNQYDTLIDSNSANLDNNVKANTKYHYIIDSKNNTYKCNDDAVETFEWQLDIPISDINAPFYLFNTGEYEIPAHTATPWTTDCCIIGNIYNFMYYENDVLQMNLVPVYRKLDNKPGMYDTVGNKFFTNIGSGADFTVGPDVN